MLNQILEASQNSDDPYEAILESARQVDAARPKDDMHQWTSRSSNYDAGWLERKSLETDLHILSILMMHPSWPVVQGIIEGLRLREIRVKEEHILLNDAMRVKQYDVKLKALLDDLSSDIAFLDRANLRSLINVRSLLATAYDELEAGLTKLEAVERPELKLVIEMHRARFKVNEDDYRPVVWPIKHPYWCTGYGDGYSIVVAYVDSEKQLLEQWPEASDIDLGEPVTEYIFTDRFPRPDWFSGDTQ